MLGRESFRCTAGSCRRLLLGVALVLWLLGFLAFHITRPDPGL